MEFLRNAIRRVLWLFIKRPVGYRLRSFRATNPNPNAPDTYRTMSEYIDGEW